MPQIDDHGRPEPPLAGDEASTLLGFLEYQRATLAWKTAGVDAEGLGTKVAASSMTLAGLLKHMALVEDNWFSRWLDDRDRKPPWNEVDWRSDPDWEWRTAPDDPPEEVRALWQERVDAARARVDAALATGGLDQLSARTYRDGTAPSLRWILCHMIEEYARHNGHADLLREAIDGETGE